jgi:ParB/RepB/Spo0J family partition protein
MGKKATIKKKTAVDTSVPKIKSMEVRPIVVQELVSNSSQPRGMGALSRLQSLGYGLFEQIEVAEEGEEAKQPIWSMLFSDKPDVQAAAVNLIKEHEPEVFSLAQSMRGIQLQPIAVWEPSKNDGYDVIFGMQRSVAAAINHAQHGDEAVIEAKVYEFESTPTDVQLRLMAGEENAKRKKESPIDKGINYSWLVEQGLTREQIAKRIDMSLQHVSDHINLLDPLLEDKRMDIHLGKLSVDAALKKLRQRKGTSGTPGDSGRNGEEGVRLKLHGTKKYVKLLTSAEKPEDIVDEEWEYLQDESVRQYLWWKLMPTEMEYLSFEKVQEMAEEARVAAEAEAERLAEEAANAEEAEPEEEEEEVAEEEEAPPPDPKPAVKAGKGKKATVSVANPPVATGTTKKVTLKVPREHAKDLLIALGKTHARTMKDEDLKKCLENIPNQMESPDQKVETKALQKTLDRLKEGYKQGLTVEITKPTKA